jgi:hypothetical protein
MIPQNMMPLSLSDETKHVLKVLASELERIAHTYADVKMYVPAAAYLDIANKLKAAADNKVRPIPKLIFSYGNRPYDVYDDFGEYY